MANEIVRDLKMLLGEPVVLIRWPPRVKAAKRKWKHLRPEDMTPAYLSKLPAGNIGVALGKVSGGLCQIDFDLNELVKPFLDLNPQLGQTLRTRGSRGAGFWIRFTGSYPEHTIRLRTHSGKEAGEFRSSGSQSIIWGTHPDTQKPYEFLIKKPVITLSLDSLRWPPEIVNPFKNNHCTEETEETEETEATEETEELKSSAGKHARLFHSTINTIEDALRVSRPTAKRENNRCLFTLARAIKALQIQGMKFDVPQLKRIFEKWYSLSREFLRDGRSKEAYYLEFMNACQRAKHPLGGTRLTEAWKRAMSKALPQEATEFDDPKLRQLIAFLKELQAMAGTEPFFITLRDCAAFLQQKTHTTAYTWLGALMAEGYIRIAEPGNDHRATRYRYVWSDDKQEST